MIRPHPDIERLLFSAEQIQTFIPSVFEFLKNKLPGDVTKKLDDLLPADVLAHK